MKTFEELFDELTSKVATGDSTSRTVAAISQGVHTVGKKVVEELRKIQQKQVKWTDQDFIDKINYYGKREHLLS